MAAAARAARVPAALALLLVLGAAGCAPEAMPPSAVLPADAVAGAGDPTRAAILHAADAFSRPGRLAGRPEEAARAVAEVEHLAVELSTGPRWAGLSPLVGQQMQAARAELRGALGIPPGAPPQAVIDQLFAASRALRAGDRAGAAAALSPPVFPAGGQATLDRLAMLPPLPRTASATALAQQEMIRSDRERHRGPGPLIPRGIQ
ncbi:hypothetical protein GCM10010964_31890 [Caldovatus sediminis]|uniref:Uncharacterized protein n=1 Tax=Caldovatus sediminis TaxID=2041189 RepID=A0A8J2ZDI1_9PROT|nr:hypothetical protein [Caldovatus sediminis]GGG42022.1 hypothetical protein GCM10010964_31890 [Caldovatus sediminis]